MHNHFVSLGTKRPVAHQYTALLTLPDRNMPPIEADAGYHCCLPSCELHMHGSWISINDSTFTICMLYSDLYN